MSREEVKGMVDGCFREAEPESSSLTRVEPQQVNQPDQLSVCKPVAGQWKRVSAGLCRLLPSLNEDARGRQARFACPVQPPGDWGLGGAGCDSVHTSSPSFLLQDPLGQPVSHMLFEVKRLALGGHVTGMGLHSVTQDPRKDSPS